MPMYIAESIWKSSKFDSGIRSPNSQVKTGKAVFEHTSFLSQFGW